MGLEIYVGSLTRYFCGEWETALYQILRKKGYSSQQMKEESAKREKVCRDEIYPEVVEWKQKINDEMKSHFANGADWNEDAMAPYFVDQLHFQSHSSLMLWAAYSEHPSLTRPKECVEEFQNDEAFCLCAEENSPTEFKHLLRGTVCWLPIDFEEPFKAVDICEEELVYGSSVQLLNELSLLNGKTWKADKATIERWRRLGLGQSCSLEEAAKYGLSVFLPLVVKSIENKLVMRLVW